MHWYVHNISHIDHNHYQQREKRRNVINKTFITFRDLLIDCECN